ncbi:MULTISPECIES: formylglycine-generating enzyme family protein [unclassified Streptomyces]|uniref:formylglycine-generating enzyme family protein n=1 Tax=unclassified Streptomyces TaxID=2593676 RepID=UPI001EFCD6C0|nr:MULTISPECIES: formylglycine-generating enzyme family protein [unclassified Streptomyces]QZZ28349.1 formylglycine-generating enzyme family protein [Streptomyces sp. ST1015]
MRLQMITVGAGEVVLNDRRTARSWTVKVDSYALSACPVTQADYAAVTGAALVDPGLPVVDVSWIDAVRYCNTLSLAEGSRPAYRFREDGDIELLASSTGYRLPTEAEWEFACRAGTSGPRYGVLDDIAWHRANSGERIRHVGTRAPNSWGFHDLLGNVWEWCWDLYDPEVYGTYRVLRGGGWFDEHWSCRASVRRRSHPTYAVDDVGFRVARSV